MQWGYDNRTAGLRVPMSDADARRVENRVGGADANPYIAIAASLACGYLGMVEGLQAERADHRQRARPAVRPAALARRGAASCCASASRWSTSSASAFVSAYTIVKEAEYEVFLQVISSWEREHLLLNV